MNDHTQAILKAYIRWHPVPLGFDKIEEWKLRADAFISELEQILNAQESEGNVELMDLNPEEAILRFYSESDPEYKDVTFYAFVSSFRKWLHYTPEHHRQCGLAHRPVKNCIECKSLHRFDMERAVKLPHKK